MADKKSRSNSIAPNAKGDLVVGTGSAASAVLGVGTNNYVLTADSTQTAGIKWAAVAAGANWSLLNAGGTALTGAATITVSGISGMDKLMILVSGASSASAMSEIKVRLNTDTGTNYNFYGFVLQGDVGYTAGISFPANNPNETAIFLSRMGNNASSTASGYVLLSGCNTSGVKTFTMAAASTTGGSNQMQQLITGGYYNSSSTISSVSVVSLTGNLDAGTVYVYGSA